MSDRIYIDLICLVGNPNSLLNLKIITVFYGDSPFVITSSFSFYFSIPLASLFFHFIVKSHCFLPIFFFFFWELVWFGVGFGSNGGAVYTKSYAFCCKATRLPLEWKWKCFVFRRQVIGFVIFGWECKLLDQTLQNYFVIFLKRKIWRQCLKLEDDALRLHCIHRSILCP